MYHALGLVVDGDIWFSFTPLSNLPSIIFFDLWDNDFFGTLITLVLTDLKWLGAITPIGLCLIIGWLLFAYNIYFRS